MQLSSSLGRHHELTPMNVPLTENSVMNMMKTTMGKGGFCLHEIVAMSLAQSTMLACSVLEGVGRTLKGRGLRQVRNAVWKQTGFLD
ncbi:hypothetical protein SLEP1_g43280 [Rubroshorea leprosula]|uniref:Uncharacterized protein n=1 Tax=Rubroshorea leprosula TaxID=152421 RepID=A0AAV5LCS9_9ROSI|nr:hypothetical protein SLEP1_g43280 [Rubroshorea leprosula]